MLLTDRPPVSTAPRGGGTNSLRLRLRNDGQLIDVPLGKTTVGSSPRCNLRIEEPGVQPLHCLIVHGPEGLSVRRWAADTKLNGVAFDDARLAAGDCLTLGGVELELVAPPVEAVGRKASAPTADLTAVADSSTLSSNAIAKLHQSNFEAASIAKDRETTAFDWSSVRPTFQAVADEADESTEDECAMLMDVVQDSFAAMNNWEDEPADAGDSEPFEFVGCAQEHLPATDVAVEETIGDEFFSDLAVADERDTELDIDEVADAIVSHVTDFHDTDVSEVSIVDAAEVVFRELQAACAMSRSRNWKMLTALRKEREQKQELLERLVEASEQLEALSAQQAEDFAVSDTEATEGRDWEQEVRRLRRQIAAWERQVAEYAARMTELQQELAVAKAGEVATGHITEPNELPSVHADEDRSDWSKPSNHRDFTTEPGQGCEVGIVTPELSTPAACDVAECAVDGPAEVTSEDTASESYEPVIGEDPFGVEQRQADEWVSPSRDVADFGELEATAEPVQVEDVGQAFGEDDTSDPFGDAPQPASWSDLVRQSQVGVPVGTGCNDRSTTPTCDEAGDVFGDGSKSTSATAIDVEAPAWAGRETESLHTANKQAEDDVSPFAEFSIWKQGAKEESPAAAAEADAEPQAEVESVPSSREELVAAPVVDTAPVLINQAPTRTPVIDQPAPAIQEVNEPVRPAAQPTSFIERYAHLFEDDNARETPAEVLAPPAVPASTTASKPRGMGIVSESGDSAPAATSDEEESIEDYMAKLLQRVRGDVPVASAAVSTVAAEKVALKPVDRQASAREQSQDGDSVESEDDAEQAEIDWEGIARKAALAPKANIGALRALANQSARQAISRHALARHRRDMVTKVIVSTLAGMTSLWLMLEAPSWYDLQCVTAGIALIGAAYWAVEAYQELSAGWRVAAAYEALHGDDDVEVTLPIDVEAR